MTLVNGEEEDEDDGVEGFAEICEGVTLESPAIGCLSLLTNCVGVDDEDIAVLMC